MSFENMHRGYFMLSSPVRLVRNSYHHYKLFSGPMGSSQPGSFLYSRKPKTDDRIPLHVTDRSGTFSWKMNSPVRASKCTSRVGLGDPPNRLNLSVCSFAEMVSRTPGELDIQSIRWKTVFVSSSVNRTTWPLAVSFSQSEPR